MIKIGKRQKLIINNFASVGAYLDAGTGDSKDNILLPNNELENRDLDVGDEVEVLIYMDSEDRPIATFRKTEALVGSLSKLEVVDKTDFGAFLSWGLNKDLFLPKSQQAGNIKIGNKYLVGIYEDSKGRLAATMKIYNFLLPTTSLTPNEIVKGTVYQIKKDVGVYVAVQNRYYGLIHNAVCFDNNYNIGDEIEARVVRIREDGKIDLSPSKLIYEQTQIDAELIFSKIKLLRDNFKFNDSSNPEDISNYFGISKKAFKRAIGTLLKEHKITKTEDGYFRIVK